MNRPNDVFFERNRDNEFPFLFFFHDTPRSGTLALEPVASSRGIFSKVSRDTGSVIGSEHPSAPFLSLFDHRCLVVARVPYDSASLFSLLGPFTRDPARRWTVSSIETPRAAWKSLKGCEVRDTRDVVVSARENCTPSFVSIRTSGIFREKGAETVLFFLEKNTILVVRVVFSSTTL